VGDRDRVVVVGEAIDPWQAGGGPAQQRLETARGRGRSDTEGAEGFSPLRDLGDRGEILRVEQLRGIPLGAGEAASLASSLGPPGTPRAVTRQAA
ncbi:MAG TPA: hypothetical protein P5314_03345, partial [Tetrasphaera sp.]|nr:hypothetical protein [Tetrasphaera sp.]